jgi:23S rRNA (pseudouridine1915-N3)-methyltransferase
MPRPIGHVTVAAVGRLREPYWLAAQDEYVRRLEHYTDFKLVEVRDAVGRSLPDSAALAREGEALLAAARGAARLILMSADGRTMSSPKLADYLQSGLESFGELTFLIGGPLGFAPAVLAAAHDRLSLSRLTLPHELARVVLLEQLYRAFTIIHGEPYHK